ncbi:helix-turn-helix domain-containing protein [Arcobacter arenosus]|uniref:Helix-turn-helix transcriptional regulator n=1 Tax=Arcobacter arenosus TaxID=2576037 RepID=A0A5R8Y500_9BACT|nr:helix-turn-helix transcriptional regulator [Arcobacter arenosus]TLP41146.1 helix-turn-helix transcriptional regulator [Arcobacter arenosus]
MENEFFVGTKIKELRVNLNMSAKDLANNAQISVGMLSQLENGSTQGSVETLRKIAKVLNTTLAQLFANEEEITSKAINDESFYVVRSENRKKISFPDPPLQL